MWVSIPHEGRVGRARGVLLQCLFLDKETEAQSFAQSHRGGAGISAKVSSALKMEFFPLDNTAFQMKAEIDKISP